MVSTNNRPNIRTSNRITFNVSGERFETFELTLQRFPDSLLGKRESRLPFYSSHSEQYYFNRNKKCFENILFFYQSYGTLRCPDGFELEDFEEECKFFELPSEKIQAMKLEAGILPNLQEVKRRANQGELRSTSFHIEIYIKKRVYC